MTIGEKIRYLRDRMGITQSKLAELTGIHPVSIRKYETNKMEPQTPQVERIAEAMNISATAILGIDHTNMRLETYGDLMGIIMVLHNSNVIIIDGERDEKNMLKPESVHIKINPLLKGIFEVNIKGEKTPLTDILFDIKNKNILTDLAKWEKINSDFLKHKNNINLSIEEKKILDTLAEAKEAIEMELQRSAVMLDNEYGIAVKIPPNTL